MRKHEYSKHITSAVMFRFPVTVVLSSHMLACRDKRCLVTALLASTCVPQWNRRFRTARPSIGLLQSLPSVSAGPRWLLANYTTSPPLVSSIAGVTWGTLYPLWPVQAIPTSGSFQTRALYNMESLAGSSHSGIQIRNAAFFV